MAQSAFQEDRGENPQDSSDHREGVELSEIHQQEQQSGLEDAALTPFSELPLTPNVEFKLSREQIIAAIDRKIEECPNPSYSEQKLKNYIRETLPHVASFTLQKRGERGWRLEYPLGPDLVASGAVKEYDADFATTNRYWHPEKADLDQGTFDIWKREEPGSSYGTDIFESMSLEHLSDVLLELTEPSGYEPTTLTIFSPSQINVALHEVLSDTPGLFSAVTIGIQMYRTTAGILAREIAGRWEEFEQKLASIPTTHIRQQAIHDDALLTEDISSWSNIWKTISMAPPEGSNRPRLLQAAMGIFLIGIELSIYTGTALRKWSQSRESLISSLRESAEKSRERRTTGAGYSIAKILKRSRDSLNKL